MIDFDTWQALVQLQTDYASAIDNAEWERWRGFFTDRCSYRLQPRENHARGLPLATLSFESVGMLKDRAYGIRETLFHDPYYQRHVLSPPRILAVAGEGAAWTDLAAADALAPDDVCPQRPGRRDRDLQRRGPGLCHRQPAQPRQGPAVRGLSAGP